MAGKKPSRPLGISRKRLESELAKRHLPLELAKLRAETLQRYLVATEKALQKESQRVATEKLSKKEKLTAAQKMERLASHRANLESQLRLIKALKEDIALRREEKVGRPKRKKLAWRKRAILIALKTRVRNIFGLAKKIKELNQKIYFPASNAMANRKKDYEEQRKPLVDTLRKALQEEKALLKDLRKSKFLPTEALKAVREARAKYRKKVAKRRGVRVSDILTTRGALKAPQKVKRIVEIKPMPPKVIRQRIAEIKPVPPEVIKQRAIETLKRIYRPGVSMRSLARTLSVGYIDLRKLFREASLAWPEEFEERLKRHQRGKK